VDDLDRCDPNKAIRILEAIKLLLNKQGFIFIIALADKILEDYVLKRYREDFKVEEKYLNNQQYLDKIIQFSLRIPSHETRAIEFINEIRVQNSNLLSIDNFNQIIPLIILTSQYNPRKIKRILNSLIVDVALIDNIEEGKRPKLFYVFFWRIIEYNFFEAYILLKHDKYINIVRRKIYDNAKFAKKLLSKAEKTIVSLLTDEDFRFIFTSELGKKWLTDKFARENALYFYVNESHEDTTFFKEKSIIRNAMRQIFMRELRKKGQAGRLEADLIKTLDRAEPEHVRTLAMLMNKNPEWAELFYQFYTRKKIALKNLKNKKSRMMDSIEKDELEMIDRLLSS
jgi:hypothetical protein